MAVRESGHYDTTPHQMYGWDGSKPVKITSDGTGAVSVNTGLSQLPGFNIPPFDRIDATYPDGVTEVYVYSLSAVTVATITVIYTDTTKNFITSAVKT
jgi:hypothetical protein